MVSENIQHSTTISDLFLRRVEESADSIAYEYEQDGEWIPVTWRVYGDRVRWMALGLHSIGLQPGSRMGIWGDTTPEWTILDLAVMALGGCSAGIYQTSTPEQAAYILNDSAATAIAVDTEERLKVARAIASETPHVGFYVTWTGESDPDENVYCFDDVIALGKALDEEQPDRYANFVQAVTPETTAVLIYTSGTTGPPKGALLSHKNCLFCCRAVHKALGLDETMTSVSFLPLSHVAEHVVGFFNRLYADGTAYFMPDLTRFVEVAKLKQPTVLGAVPRLFEKIYSAIIEKVEAAPPRKRGLFNWALKMGAEAAEYRLKGESMPATRAARYRLADKLVLSKLRDLLGGRVQYMVCGAAPIAREIVDFWNAVGITFFEVYGMTETSGISHMNSYDAYQAGTVGTVVPGYECKIAQDGEILIRGDGVFQGYLNRPEATAETIDADGWLYTGDIGEEDADGFLRITDRKKNLIITAGGKNVAPSNIELLITRESLVSQVIVIGDRRRFLAALITLSAEELVNLASSNGFADMSVEEIIESESIRQRVHRSVERANEELARYENVRKYKILTREFSIEEGEMTPTMKLKRKVIEERYAHIIEEFYAVEHVVETV